MKIIRRNWYVLMQEAGDGGAGGAGGGEAGGAAAAGAGAGGGGEGGGAAAAPGSVLAAGAAGTGGEGEEFSFIPEKLRVSSEDGKFDLAASSKKMAEAYGNLEKRFGSGDVPPKSAEEYAVTVPDAFKESWKPEEDQSFQDFRAKAFDAGMTQKQLDLVMGQYFEMAPKLVAGAAVMDSTACTTELQKEWATPATFQRNVGLAYSAASALAGKAGMDVQQIMTGPLANNPQFLKLMAALGPELAEDKNPNGGDVMSADAIEDLMASEAYTNPGHKDHARVSQKVKAHFEKAYGTEAAA